MECELREDTNYKYIRISNTNHEYTNHNHTNHENSALRGCWERKLQVIIDVVKNPAHRVPQRTPEQPRKIYRRAGTHSSMQVPTGPGPCPRNFQLKKKIQIRKKNKGSVERANIYSVFKIFERKRSCRIFKQTHTKLLISLGQ